MHTILRNGKNVKDLLRNWKKEFLANAPLAFDNKREDNLREKLAEERKEKAEYAKKVGQLTMQVDWLKKKSEEVVGPDYESKFSPKPFDDLRIASFYQCKVAWNQSYQRILWRHPRFRGRTGMQSYH